MSLNHYIKNKRKHNLKAAIKIMRSKWYEGEYQNFVDRLARVLGCSIEEAKAICEEWLICGFLRLNERGLLTWRNVRSEF
jgi:hypothetical protein